MTRGSTTQIIQYEYDENNRLTRENNQQTGLTTLWSYKSDGNFSAKQPYPYTTGNDLSTMTANYFYGYIRGTNKLQGYGDYQKFTYDELGNPLSYMNRTMSWEGRQLKTVNSGSNSISYTYNSDGLRRTKTVNGQTTVYEYSGTQLIHEQRPTFDLYYQYDESGNLVKITKKQNTTTTNYYVATNIRGDVEAIYNENGQLQARYVYDAWGKVKSVLDVNNNQITDTNHIGHINPIRYRGYYYDTETSFYYLQSRYYDPEVGRFINSDFQINSDILGNNLYVYCRNNPINYEDDEGKVAVEIILGLKIAFSIVADIYISAKIKEASGEEYTSIDLISSVVPNLFGLSKKIEHLSWIAATTIEVINCISTNETVTSSAYQVGLTALSSKYGMNDILEATTNVELDFAIETLNDLTFGSGQFLLTTGLKQYNFDKNGVAAIPMCSGLINFKKNNKSPSFGGNCYR